MLRDRLGKELLFFDGGMGTLLRQKDFCQGNFRKYGIWNTQKRWWKSTESILKPGAILY